MPSDPSSTQVRISSRYVPFLKRVFPVLWFGILGVVLLSSLAGGRNRQPPMLWIMPLIMAVFGFWIMKKTVWILADEVQDCGDHLLVRRGSEQCVVRIADVMNVGASTTMNPPTITLRLAVPCVFGNEIAFSPARPFSLDPFARNPIAEDLIVRVDAARRQRLR